MQDILAQAQSLILSYGLSLIWAIIVFIIGRWVAGILANLVRKAMNRANVDKSLIGFAGTMTYYAVVIFAAVAALSLLGVQTASIIAVIGAAGLAVGLALQGSLANFAAGVLILLFRPFKVGDVVEINGVTGKVKEIQIFSTILLTLDNTTIIVPNSAVTGNNIINYSSQGVRRLDMVFGIGYEDDILKAKRILQEILAEDERIQKEPAPTVAVLELADSSVNFAVRPYVKPDDYIPVMLTTTEKVKLRFDKESISIPYPQQDVHLFKAPA